jgi:hypothetical protein
MLTLTPVVTERGTALAALAALPPQDREALLLVAWDGLTAAQAARGRCRSPPAGEVSQSGLGVFDEVGAALGPVAPVGGVGIGLAPSWKSSSATPPRDLDQLREDLSSVRERSPPHLVLVAAD